MHYTKAESEILNLLIKYEIPSIMVRPGIFNPTILYNSENIIDFYMVIDSCGIFNIVHKDNDSVILTGSYFDKTAGLFINGIPIEILYEDGGLRYVTGPDRYEAEIKAIQNCFQTYFENINNGCFLKDIFERIKNMNFQNIENMWE